MLFNSYIFILAFLPITVAGTWLLAYKSTQTVCFLWLIAASLFFYSWWNPANLPLLLCSIGINYSIGKRLAYAPQRWLITLGIAFNIAALGYYKYAGFFTKTLATLLEANWFIAPIALPLAISFFTFQQIAYLVDAYRGETKDYSIIKYLLFVCFFPQLIAGPIVHHQEMWPQFRAYGRQVLTSKPLATGMVLFTLGLVKKVLLADGLAPFATPVFQAAADGINVTFFEAWGGALAYTLQLYFDFSGYADMAIGTALMLGIYLPLNFNSPYKATSIIDFWRRWHITLSRFLRTYIYIPLGGKYQRYRNLLITMMLAGIWHGAGFTFLWWGMLHGVYLCINHGWLKTGLRLPSALAWLITMLAVIVSWVLFRAETLTSAKQLLFTMAGGNGIIVPDIVVQQLSLLPATTLATGGQLIIKLGDWAFTGMPLLSLGVTITLFFPNSQQLVGYGEPATKLRWRPTMVWNIGLAVLLGYTLLQLGGLSEFLYFQF